VVAGSLKKRATCAVAGLSIVEYVDRGGGSLEKLRELLWEL
jgi:hypothetical protein